MIQVIIGFAMGFGLILLSFQEKITFGIRSFRAGEEIPNEPFFKIAQRLCGGILLVAALWKLRLILR